MGGKSSSASGAGKKRFGPIHWVGAARSSQTGSMSIRIPSISTREVECPIQVMRRPEWGLVAYMRGSVLKGPGVCFGDRAAFPNKNFGSTFHIVENPPTLVATGLAKRRPSRRAGSRGMPIRCNTFSIDVNSFPARTSRRQRLSFSNTHRAASADSRTPL